MALDNFFFTNVSKTTKGNSVMTNFMVKELITKEADRIQNVSEEYGIMVLRNLEHLKVFDLQKETIRSR